MPREAEELSLDADNNKIYLTESGIGNYDELVPELCRAIAKGTVESEFYGHAFYDDLRCGYESCADYEYVSEALKITVIESQEGSGLCPECGEQIVCFDEYDSNEEYVCEKCGFKVENHEDMFDGCLPTVKEYEEKIV